MASSRSSIFEPVSRGADEVAFLQTYKAELQGDREGIVLRRLNCTICSINIKHRLLSSRNEHPLLSVLVCNTCSHRIRCALGVHQKANHRNFCVWCMSEDKSPSCMVKCTDCSRKFCTMCIRKNVPKDRKISPWKCFACKPNSAWLTLRALCCESVQNAEQQKKYLEERRRRVSSSLLNAASRRAMNEGPLYQSVITNISTLTAEGPSNLSTTVTVSTSPTMRGRASVSVSVHHNASQDLFSTPSPTARRETPSIIKPPVETKSTASDAESAFTCVVCLDQEARLACIPCGHLCLCEGCFSTYRKSYTRCPLCWNTYYDKLKIFGGNR